MPPWLYQKIMQYTCNICHYSIKDIYYLDSIILWPVHTTPKSMHVHDLECTFLSTSGVKNQYPQIHINTEIHVTNGDILPQPKQTGFPSI